MGKRDQLDAERIQAFLTTHPGWELAGGGLVKTFEFGRYAACIAFVVELAFAAEKKDHHPDLSVTWGKVGVRWSTHDAGGVTALDTELAEATDGLFDRS
jgi:4a-hydroxytetrahydrobiopterin dehydratase